MTGLGLPERLVLAAETAIEGQAEDVTLNRLGSKVYGFTADFARYGAGAVVEALADELLARRCCPADSVTSCSDCCVLDDQARHFRALAQLVRDVPALEAV